MTEPVLPEDLVDELRRARFHERENYQRWQDAQAAIERVRALADGWAAAPKPRAFGSGTVSARRAAELVCGALDGDSEPRNEAV